MDERPFSSVKTVSSSDWSLRRSHGRIEAESAISWTGAMLGRRLPVPFTVGGTSLPPEMLGGLVFWRSMATVPANTTTLSQTSLYVLPRPIQLFILLRYITRYYCLTHACNDAVHRKLRWPVIDPPSRTPLPLLLVKAEGWVLLFGDVDVIAGICGSHDVVRTRVQQDALVVLSFYTDETDAIPGDQISIVSIQWVNKVFSQPPNVQVLLLKKFSS